MAAFMEAHPGVEIEVIDIDSGPLQLDAVLNDPDLKPDIVELNVHQAGKIADRLLNLAEWMRQATGWSGAYVDLTGRASPAGDPVMLPIRVEPMVVYYDPTQFAELGLTEPKEGWTIFDFTEAAKKLAEAGRTVRFPDGLAGPEAIIRGWGGGYVSPDRDAVQGWLDGDATFEAFVRYAQLVPEGADPGSSKELAALGIGRAGTLRQLIQSAYANYGIGPLPKMPDGTRINTAYMSGLAVMRDSAQTEPALAFLEWILGESDEEALSFAALHTLDTISRSFRTSENAGVAALREQMKLEIAVSEPAAFDLYVARPGYNDRQNPKPDRSAEQIAAWRDRETARHELSLLAQQLESWMEVYDLEANRAN